MADMRARDDAFFKQVFRKTPAGQSEVIHRSSTDLPQRVRTLLVMVDGRTTAEALLARLAALQITDAAFQLLVDRGLVEPASAPAGVFNAVPSTGMPGDLRGPASAFLGPSTVMPGQFRRPLPASPAPMEASPAPSSQGPAAVGRASGAPDTESRPAGTTAPRERAPITQVPPEIRKQELYEFFTQTIRELLGLRGYLLQLTVERADSIEDFREIRDRFLIALEKSKGPEIARALRERIDRMLR